MLGRVVLGAVAALSAAQGYGATATRVVDYDFGVGAHANPGYRNVANALGETSRDTGTSIFGDTRVLYISNPYNNPWQTTDIVSIGKGGHITLELSNYAVALADRPEINVLVFQQIMAATGQPWYDREARVSVSENGTDWVQLNGGNIIWFDIPAAGYVLADIPQDSSGGYGAIKVSDLPLYQVSDYGLPMPGVPDFGPDVGDTLADAYGLSGGGNWLDISGTGLAQVGYIRFDVPTEIASTRSTSGYFMLDAVYVNNDAVGAAVPEPSAAGLLLIGASVLGLRGRKHKQATR